MFTVYEYIQLHTIIHVFTYRSPSHDCVGCQRFSSVSPRWLCFAASSQSSSSSPPLKIRCNHFSFLTTIIAIDVQAPLPSQHADLFSLTEYLLEKKSLGAIRHVLAITILRSGEDNDYQSDDPKTNDNASWWDLSLADGDMPRSTNWGEKRNWSTCWRWSRWSKLWSWYAALNQLRWKSVWKRFWHWRWLTIPCLSDERE